MRPGKEGALLLGFGGQGDLWRVGGWDLLAVVECCCSSLSLSLLRRRPPQGGDLDLLDQNGVGVVVGIRARARTGAHRWAGYWFFFFLAKKANTHGFSFLCLLWLGFPCDSFYGGGGDRDRDRDRCR